MDFEIIGELTDVETIAVNLSIRENADLKARYGGRRWPMEEVEGQLHRSIGQWQRPTGRSPLV
jgi:hypothetical protein